MNLAGAQLAAFEEAQLRRFGPAVLVVLTFLLLLPANNIIPLVDTDEPRFAQATREMIDRHDWIVPYFNGNYRFDKPILIYWLMRPCYALFGINEFAARLPSVLATALLVWLTFYIGTRWFNAVAGFTAGFTLLTCVQILLHGRGAVADMPMVLAVLAANYALFELLNGHAAVAAVYDRRPPESTTETGAHRAPLQESWRWFLLLYISLGLGFLAKGPVALVVPLLTVVLYRFVFWRQPLPWRRLRLPLGLLVTLAIIAAWGVPALVRTHGLFFRVGIGEHVVARGHESFQGHGSWAPYYYLVSGLFSLFPWIAFAGVTVQAVRRNWNQKNAFLLAWCVGTYGLFTCYLTKLPHYVLPAFPALFLMLGQAAEPTLMENRWSRGWFWFVLSLLSLVGLAALAAGFVIQFTESFVGLRWMLFGGAGIVFALVSLALRWRTGRLLFAVIPIIAIVLGTWVFGLGLRRVTPATQLQPLFRQMPANTTYAWSHFNGQSLVFYAAQPWQSLTNTDAISAFLAQPGPRVAVCEERAVRIGEWFKSRRTHAPLTSKPDFTKDLATLDPPHCARADIDGLDIVHGSWVYLRVYYRHE